MKKNLTVFIQGQRLPASKIKYSFAVTSSNEVLRWFETKFGASSKADTGCSCVSCSWLLPSKVPSKVTSGVYPFKVRHLALPYGIKQP